MPLRYKPKYSYGKNIKRKSATARISRIRGISTGTVAKIADKRIVSHAEKKYFTTESLTAYTTIDFNGSITNISAVPQGDTDLSRDGDELYIRSMTVKFNWIVGDATNLVRTIVFQWLNNSTPTVSGTTGVLNAVGLVGSPLEPYIHDQRSYFRILYDKTFQLTTNHSQQMGTAYITKFPRKKISYSASGTTIVNGGLWLIFLSDSGAANHPSVIYKAKLNFIDG